MKTRILLVDDEEEFVQALSERLTLRDYDVTTCLSGEAAIEKVTAALKEEGFGVLTTIDVKDTLKKKLEKMKKDYEAALKDWQKRHEQPMRLSPELKQIWMCFHIIAVW